MVARARRARETAERARLPRSLTVRHRSSRRGVVQESRFPSRSPRGDPVIAPWPHPSVAARPAPSAPAAAHVSRHTASAPGDHTRSDQPRTRRRLRGHAAASPSRGRHRTARHILPASSYAGRCIPTVYACCQSVVGRVVRRAIRNVARRTPPGASARLRPATSGSIFLFSFNTHHESVERAGIKTE